MSSFTMFIKEEICQKSFEDCCQKSLVSAFIRLNNQNNENIEGFIKFSSFHESTINLFTRLLKNQFQEVNFIKHKSSNVHVIEIPILDYKKIVNKIYLQDLNFASKNMKKHCIRAYIAGVFLLSGSINSPQTSNYHLELQFNELIFASELQKLLSKKFNLNFKIIKRRNKYVLYLKKSNHISDFLKLLDCPEAVFNFEDKRITRELLNTINRYNNIDISNQQKIFNASLKQIEMIKEIKKINSFSELSDKCQILADLRLTYQDASLHELGGEYFKKTGEIITKSGVNHLMRELRKKYQELLSINF